MIKYLFSLLVFIGSIDLVYAQPNPVRIIEGYQRTTKINFTSDGVYLYISSVGGVHKVEFETEKLIRTYQTEGHAVDFNSDFTLMATGNVGSKTRLYDTETGELLHIFEGHDETIGSGHNELPSTVLYLAFSNNNDYLVSVSNDGKAFLWDMTSKDPIHIFFRTFNPNTREFTNFIAGATVFSPDDSLIIFGHTLWDSKTFEQVSRLGEITPSFKFVNFSKSGNLFFTNAIGELNVWDWKTKQNIIQTDLDGEHNGLFSIDTSPDEKYLLGSSSDGYTYIFDIETEYTLKLKTSDNSIGINHHPSQFHPNGKYFVVGSNDGNLLVYDFQEVLSDLSNISNWNDYE